MITKDKIKNDNQPYFKNRNLACIITATENCYKSIHYGNVLFHIMEPLCLIMRTRPTFSSLVIIKVSITLWCVF